MKVSRYSLLNCVMMLLVLPVADQTTVNSRFKPLICPKSLQPVPVWLKKLAGLCLCLQDMCWVTPCLLRCTHLLQEIFHEFIPRAEPWLPLLCSLGPETSHSSRPPLHGQPEPGEAASAPAPFTCWEAWPHCLRQPFLPAAHGSLSC